MRKMIQRGLLAAVASGGMILLGNMAAHADTAPAQPLNLGGLTNSVSSLLGGSHGSAAVAGGNTTSGSVAGNGGNSGNGGGASSSNSATSGNSGASGNSGSTGGNSAYGLCVLS